MTGTNSTTDATTSYSDDTAVVPTVIVDGDIAVAEVTDSGAVIVEDDDADDDPELESVVVSLSTGLPVEAAPDRAAINDAMFRIRDEFAETQERLHTKGAALLPAAQRDERTRLQALLETPNKAEQVELREVLDHIGTIPPADRTRADKRALLLAQAKLTKPSSEERGTFNTELRALNNAARSALDASDRSELTRVYWELDRIQAKIYEANLGLVLKYVRMFTSNTSLHDSQDFEAAGMLGLMRAIATFRVDRGRFSSWAFKPIMREVIKAVRDADHANLNTGDFERRPEILRARDALVAERGPDAPSPSIEEVSVKAGINAEQVRRVLNAPRLQSTSLPVGDDGETELGDFIPDSSATFEDNVGDAQTLRAIQEWALPVLDARELFVLVSRMGLDGEPARRLSTVGEHLGLSREAVRQIQERALSKLRHPTTLRKIARCGRS